MKISYNILTHNETDSLSELIQFLVKHKDEEDEIVILDDYSDNEKTKEILDTMCSIYEVTFDQRNLHKDYAGQKNHLTHMCKGSYIVNIDADELPNKWLVHNIKSILEENPGFKIEPIYTSIVKARLLNRGKDCWRTYKYSKVKGSVQIVKFEFNVSPLKEIVNQDFKKLDKINRTTMYQLLRGNDGPFDEDKL